MYGVMFEFLREYLVKHHGGDATWRAILETTSGNTYANYFPVREYPDREIVVLVEAASKRLDLPVPVLLEGFGCHIGPRLLDYYGMYVKGENRSAFHIIEKTGSDIHQAIHRHNPSRNPPLLYGEMETENRMIVHYQSHRKMCDIARGIIRGLGEHYGERLEIEHTRCIHQGADECIFRVERL